MKRILPLFFLLVASSCSTVRTLPVQDSTRVEVRVEREIVMTPDSHCNTIPVFLFVQQLPKT